MVFCSGGYRLQKIYPISFRQVKKIIEAFQAALQMDARFEMRRARGRYLFIDVARESVTEARGCQDEGKQGKGRNDEVLSVPF